MTGKTAPARIYVEDAAWLHQLRRKLGSEQQQDMSIADIVHLLRESYEAQTTNQNAADTRSESA